MRQPARNRETGQRLARDDLSPSPGFGRMVEVGALATAASAMAIGTLEARERQAELVDGTPKIDGLRPDAADHGGDPEGDIAFARPGVQPPSDEAARLQDNAPREGHAASADAIWDPTALTARIAEQIASSVSHVLDMAAGSGGTPQTLSRDIVDEAQLIAREVHGQFVAREPLAVLADLVPHALGLDTLGQDIIRSVDGALAQSGVMDLLTGTASTVDPGGILDDIVANLHGLKLPVDVSTLADEPLQAVAGLVDSLTGGTGRHENPLADLFYDDGAAGAAQSSLHDGSGALSDLAIETPRIGFLGQPVDLAEELGGLTHGHNPLQVF